MEDEWIIEDPSESQPEEVPAEAAPAEQAAEGEAEPEAEQIVQGTDDKSIWKHWVRPKFLQYNYMYDYRYNYYNDVINYLDRRNRGLHVETPRAQTWAERALRTYMSKGRPPVAQKDKALLHHISSGARFHRYHSKSLIARKYSNLGFNTITI